MKPAPAGPDLVRLIEVALAESAEEEKLLDEIRRSLQDDDTLLALAFIRRFLGLPPKEGEPDTYEPSPQEAGPPPPDDRFTYPYIYMVETTEGPHRVKLGTSRNPKARLRELQCGSAVQLRIRMLWPGGVEDEQALHLALSEHRLHGEWFDGAVANLANRVMDARITARLEDDVELMEERP